MAFPEKVMLKKESCLCFKIKRKRSIDLYIYLLFVYFFVQIFFCPLSSPFSQNFGAHPPGFPKKVVFVASAKNLRK